MGGYEPGKIRGVLRVLREHPDEVEYELIRLGLRLRWLGSPLLTLRDLILIVSLAPRDSPLLRALNPDTGWDLHAHLLAVIFDSLNAANWQRAGGKQSTKPKPLARPGQSAGESDRARGRTDLTVPEYARQLARPRQALPLPSAPTKTQ